MISRDGYMPTRPALDFNSFRSHLLVRLAQITLEALAEGPCA